MANTGRPYTAAWIEGYKWTGADLRTLAMGLHRPVVTMCDFSVLATCYAGLTVRVRPEAALGKLSKEV
jgi:hypothetical protein